MNDISRSVTDDETKQAGKISQTHQGISNKKTVELSGTTCGNRCGRAHEGFG